MRKCHKCGNTLAFDELGVCDDCELAIRIENKRYFAKWRMMRYHNGAD